SFKNPIRYTVRCRTCGFSRGSVNIPIFQMTKFMSKNPCKLFLIRRF
ncbi:hypothetical protein FL881_13685, partial [Bacillus thuringiensis]|nr:hypothetical protein [Bacillus thuringiensis]